MYTYTVNCPECGKCFEYGEVREFVFCSNCGKKLRITWKIDRVTIDDGLPSGPVGAAPAAAAVAVQPQPQPQPQPKPQPQAAPKVNNGEVPKGYLRVTINMPLDCFDLKGNFSHFFIRWDDKEIGKAGKGESVRIRTLSRVHKLEIKQVNKRAVGSAEKVELFQVPINDDRVINIKIEGDEFVVE